MRVNICNKWSPSKKRHTIPSMNGGLAWETDETKRSLEVDHDTDR